MGTTFNMLMRPSIVLPAKSILESRPPIDGNVALQLDSGVVTTTLHLFVIIETRNSKGFNNIEKIPMLFVVVVDTMFPFSHRNCTDASAEKLYFSLSTFFTEYSSNTIINIIIFNFVVKILFVHFGPSIFSYM